MIWYYFVLRMCNMDMTVLKNPEGCSGDTEKHCSMLLQRENYKELCEYSKITLAFCRRKIYFYKLRCSKWKWLV